jgi:hypothetical protein
MCMSISKFYTSVYVFVYTCTRRRTHQKQSRRHRRRWMNHSSRPSSSCLLCASSKQVAAAGACLPYSFLQQLRAAPCTSTHSNSQCATQTNITKAGVASFHDSCSSRTLSSILPPVCSLAGRAHMQMHTCSSLGAHGLATRGGSRCGRWSCCRFGRGRLFGD